jgi:hypothetical protein
VNLAGHGRLHLNLSLADQMQNQFAAMRRSPVLEEIDALPRAERQIPADNRNGKMRLRQRGAYMRRHVVRTFGIVLVHRRFRRDALEISFHVGANGRVGILLNEQRRRGVAAEDRHESGLATLRLEKSAHLARHIGEAALRCPDGQLVLRLPHSCFAVVRASGW